MSQYAVHVHVDTLARSPGLAVLAGVGAWKPGMCVAPLMSRRHIGASGLKHRDWLGSDAGRIPAVSESAHRCKEHNERQHMSASLLPLNIQQMFSPD